MRTVKPIDPCLPRSSCAGLWFRDAEMTAPRSSAPQPDGRDGDAETAVTMQRGTGRRTGRQRSRSRVPRPPKE